MFRGEENDNLDVDLVEFHVDFQQIGTLSLEVVTLDKVGNVAEEIVRFKVEK